MLSQDYQYEPLTGGREIRLLNLEKPCGGTVRCLLTKVSLDALPVFHAVSYCWGSEEKPLEISVNGSRLKVGDNLYSMLQELSQGYEAFLWIDAICINQDSTMECEQQVQLMGEIYSRASLTIVWLGKADDHSELALEAIAQWNNLISPATLLSSEGWGDRVSVQGGGILWHARLSTWFKALTYESRRALKSLFDREWWSRMWVYQEFILSRDVSFRLGSKCMTEQSLNAFTAAFCDLCQNLEYMGLDAHTMDELKGIKALRYAKLMQQKADRFMRRKEASEHAQTSMDILQLLVWTRDLKATKPQDKLFALLGVNEDQDMAIKPSYTDSVGKVFGDFFKACVQHKKHLNYIARAGRGLLEADQEMTSWIWDLRLHHTGQWISDAIHDACLALPHQAVVDDSTLRSRGLACDRLNLVSDYSNKPKFPEWYQWFSSIDQQSHPTGVPVEQVFFRTLIGDDRCYAGGPSDSRSINTDWNDLAIGFVVRFGKEQLLQSSRERQKEVIERELDRIEKQGEKVCHHKLDSPPVIRFFVYTHTATLYKRFFTTISGYFGLGPPGIEQGDQVFVLYGCKVPLLLRKAGGSYILVGECYIFGMMQGEMIMKHRKGLLAEEEVQII